MAIHETAGFDNGNGGERAVSDVRVEVQRVLDVSFADFGIGHDGRVVLKRVANVAVFVGVGDGLAERVSRARGSVVDLILVFGDVAVSDERWRIAERLLWFTNPRIVVPLIAVILPGNIVLEKGVTNARCCRGWNREYGVVRRFVSESIFALTEVAGVVIVQQVVVAHFAVRLNRMRERLEIIHNCGDSRLRGVCAVAVRAATEGGRAEGTAAVAVL